MSAAVLDEYKEAFDLADALLDDRDPAVVILKDFAASFRQMAERLEEKESVWQLRHCAQCLEAAAKAMESR